MALPSTFSRSFRIILCAMTMAAALLLMAFSPGSTSVNTHVDALPPDLPSFVPDLTIRSFEEYRIEAPLPFRPHSENLSEIDVPTYAVRELPQPRRYLISPRRNI